MKIKLLLACTLTMLSTSAMAQSFNISSCNTVVEGFVACKATTKPVSGNPTLGYGGQGEAGFQAPNTDFSGALGAVPFGQLANTDSFFTNVPGGNVFQFCSGSRPGRKSSWRSTYDFICPKGQQ